MRGTGRIFKRGSTYWIAYCYRGKEHRESSHSDNEAQARKLLKKRVGEMGQGRLIGPGEGRLAFEDLASMLLTDYEVNGKRSLESAKLSSNICENSSAQSEPWTSRLIVSDHTFGNGSAKARQTEASTASSRL